MIIKKINFKLSPGFGAKDWPFNVSEVAVLGIIIMNGDKPLQCFAVVHNLTGYALSGVLENNGFLKLEDSGIWASATGDGAHCIPAPKKSLSPFFEFLEDKVNGNVDK